MSYSQFVFGVPLKVSETQMDQNKFDLTLYLTKEVDFVQDGTRMAENERNKLDDSHKAILDKNKIPYGEIKGDWNERFEKAKALIDNLIKLKQQQWKSHWREIE
jgi:HTH-type transcriptional repressor of NAD biosynthesis genes